LKTQSIKPIKPIEKKVNFIDQTKTHELETNSNPSNYSSHTNNLQECKVNKPITREDIRQALKQVYSEETKPVKVASIKARSEFALLLIIFGTIIIGFSIGFEYFSLDTNWLMPGLILLGITISIGVLLSTKTLRKIHRSMSRFHDKTIPVYRTVFPKSNFQSQALVYATLICLILLGIQSLNIFIISNPQIGTEDEENPLESIEIKDGMIRIDYLEVGEPRLESGQYYRFVTVIINNSNNYYSKNLNLIIQSNFAGKMYDRINLTLDQPDLDISAKVRIHEPDDTSILAFLKHYDKNGEHQLDSKIKPSLNDIYITNAIGKIITKPGILPKKSIEISVTIYNEGPPREPDSVTVIVDNPSIVGIPRGQVENNRTIKTNEFWEVKIKFDIFNEESEFKVKLNIETKTKDEANILAA
jgi:hypothetical protein